MQDRVVPDIEYSVMAARKSRVRIGIPLEPSVETKAGLVWKRGRYISKGLETFISFCKEYYGNSRPGL
ncbi:MAG: hypothetical protein VZR35_05290 [Lachnospiraceae bacterium]|nr:hypothetical protein [Lachnospiraceae bacterium]